MVDASPSDINCLPNVTDDVRTVDKLFDGVNVTQSAKHMWLIPYTFEGASS